MILTALLQKKSTSYFKRNYVLIGNATKEMENTITHKNPAATLSCLALPYNLINDILEEASEELFLAKQVSNVTLDRFDLTRNKVLQQAAEKRIALFDNNFLSGLNTFIKLSKAAGNEDVATIMYELKEAVMMALNKEMPSPVQDLEMIIHIKDRMGRFSKLDALSACTKSKQTTNAHIHFSQQPNARSILPSVHFAATQLLKDVEACEIIPDLFLSAKLTLMCEEVCIFARERERYFMTSIGFNRAHKQLPLSELTFLNELLASDKSLRRRALLKAAFLRSMDSVDLYETSHWYPRNDKSTKTLKELKSCRTVHPGRFLDTLYMIKEELHRKGTETKANSEDTMLHLGSIWLESYKVLEEIASSHH